MATFTFRQRGLAQQPAAGKRLLTAFMPGNATTGANKFRWAVPFTGYISGVYAHTTGVGSGTGNTVIDVKKNGVSIFATQPLIAVADDGYMTAGALTSNGRAVAAGDVLALDVTAVPTTSGHPNVSVTIVIEEK